MPDLTVSLDMSLFPDDADYDASSSMRFNMCSGKLTNTSKTDTYRILTWGTPLMADAFFQPLMQVVFEPANPYVREEIKGDYFQVKYRKAQAGDTITLKPGESSDTWMFRLQDIFVIKKTGAYDVTLSCKLPQIERLPAPGDSAAPVVTKDMYVSSPTVSLQIVANPKMPTTVGAYLAMANAPRKMGEAADLSVSAALPPVFVAGSDDADKVKRATVAHHAAYMLVKTAERTLSEDYAITKNEALKTWFGTNTDKQVIQAVRESYRRIARFMETKHVVYDFSHPQAITSDAYAFVTGLGGTWDRRVYLSTGFWEPSSELIGPASQSGTIVHELAHGVDMDQDFSEIWYGAEATKRLASLSVAASVMHADAIGSYAESLNPFAGLWTEGSESVYAITQPDSAKTDVTLSRLKNAAGDADGAVGTGTLAFSEDTSRFEIAGTDLQNRPFNCILSSDLATVHWPGKTHPEWYRAPQNMVYIPPGVATVGSPASEVGRVQSDESLPKTFNIEKGFFVCVLKVSIGEFKLYNQDPWFDGWDYGDAYGRDYLTHKQAKNYCAERTATEHADGVLDPKWSYRLPTELEWEYFARAGTTTAFWFGDDTAPDYPLFWQNANLPQGWHGFPSNLVLGSSTPNPWGLFDIHINLGEWCDGWLPVSNIIEARDYMAPGFNGTRQSPDDTHAPVRGGYYADVTQARSAYRQALVNRSNNVGFRVVLSYTG